METTEIGFLGVKAETTYGVDPVPTVSANLIPTDRDSLTWSVDSTPVRRRPLDGLSGALPGFNAMPNVTLKFRYELRGNRTNGVAADISSGSVANKVEIDALLQAANLSPSYVAASGGGRNGYVSYIDSIITGVGPSVTCYWWSQKKLHKLLGGKVDVSVDFTAGQIPFIEFTVKGKYVVPADTTFPTSSITYLATKPQIYEGGTVTLGSFTPIIRSARFDLGNRIALRSDPTDATGVGGFLITGTEPKGSLDPEADSEATNAFWADWRASTVKSLSLMTPYTPGTSTTSGNAISMSALVEPKSINYGARDGIRTHDYQFDIVRASLGAPGAFILGFL